jgi:hypothetical protein
MRWGIAAGILAHVLGVVWDAGLAQAGEVVLAMSQREVVLALGPPTGVHIERNAVVCLAYGTGWPWRWAHVLGERTRIIAFREDRLIDDAIVRSVRIRFIAPTLRGGGIHRCASMACVMIGRVGAVSRHELARRLAVNARAFLRRGTRRNHSACQGGYRRGRRAAERAEGRSRIRRAVRDDLRHRMRSPRPHPC